MTNPNIYFIRHLLFVSDTVSGQCWQAATYTESVVSPDLRSSSILRVPDVSSMAQCVGACCGLLGCDLAWFFEHRCYVLSCQRKENCQPKQRPGTDSLLAFLQRGPPQTLVLQSLVRGESFPNHWQPLPRHRGSEDHMKDLALLEGIQDLDNTDAEYAESFRSLDGEKRAEDRDGTTVEQEESPGLYAWPLVQGKEEFNQSETERVGERSMTVQGSLESSSFPPSHFPEMRNESRSSLIEAESDVTPQTNTALNITVSVGFRLMYIISRHPKDIGNRQVYKYYIDCCSIVLGLFLKEILSLTFTH